MTNIEMALICLGHHSPLQPIDAELLEAPAWGAPPKSPAQANILAYLRDYGRATRADLVDARLAATGRSLDCALTRLRAKGKIRTRRIGGINYHEVIE